MVGLADMLGSGLTGTVVVTLLTAIVKQSRLIGIGFEALLFFYLFYVVIPQLLPLRGPIKDLIHNRGFRTLTTTIITGFGMLVGVWSSSIFALMTSRTVSIAAGEVYVVSWAAIGWIAVAAYIYRTAWRDADDTERAVLWRGILPWRDPNTGPENIAEELARDDWIGRFGRGMAVVSMSGVVVMGCSFAGWVVGAASLLFPLPELLVLGVVIMDKFGYRLPWRPTLPRLTERTVDIETRLYSVVSWGLRSQKGLTGMVVILLGASISIILAAISALSIALLVMKLIGMAPASGLAGGESGATGHPLIAFWDLVGVMFVLAIPGPYALWFWLREISRFPHFLKYWEQAHGRKGPIRDADSRQLPPLVTRPPGVLLPPTALLVFGFGFAQAAETGWNAENSLIFAVLWPFVVGGVLWTIRWTYRFTPQPVTTESRVMLAALLIQGSWLGIGLLGTGQIPSLPLTIFGLALFIWLYYWADIEVRADETEGILQYLDSASLVVIGSIALGLLPFAQPGGRWMFYIMIVVGIGGGGLHAYIKYTDTR